MINVFVWHLSLQIELHVQLEIHESSAPTRRNVVSRKVLESKPRERSEAYLTFEGQPIPIHLSATRGGSVMPGGDAAAEMEGIASAAEPHIEMVVIATSQRPDQSSPGPHETLVLASSQRPDQSSQDPHETIVLASSQRPDQSSPGPHETLVLASSQRPDQSSQGPQGPGGREAKPGGGGDHMFRIEKVHKVQTLNTFELPPSTDRGDAPSPMREQGPLDDSPDIVNDEALMVPGEQSIVDGVLMTTPFFSPHPHQQTSSSSSQPAAAQHPSPITQTALALSQRSAPWVSFRSVY